MKLEFSRQSFEKPKHQNLSKSVEWESSCSIQTDITKLIDAFRSFANAPNKVRPPTQRSDWRLLKLHVSTNVGHLQAKARHTNPYRQFTLLSLNNEISVYFF